MSPEIKNSKGSINKKTAKRVKSERGADLLRGVNETLGTYSIHAPIPDKYQGQLAGGKLILHSTRPYEDLSEAERKGLSVFIEDAAQEMVDQLAIIKAEESKKGRRRLKK